MINRLITYLRLVLTTLLLSVTLSVASAEVGPADLKGEDKVMFDRFRHLFQEGEPDEFYKFVAEYQKDLKEKGYMMLYYKLQNNEGFYALRHHHIFRAMQVAERLDAELREDGASQYFYLATGLMGDIYYENHDRVKAEKYFAQAIEEAGDSDPKFTMRCYLSMAEMLCLKDNPQALAWAEKAINLARKTDNTEYYSMALAITAYCHFLTGNATGFFKYYDAYIDLESMEKPGFSHRYDKAMEIGRMAFDGDYEGAIAKLQDKETTYVDSSLVAICVYAMKRDLDNGFAAMRMRYLEMDSTYSAAQNANYDQMATERTLMRSREEAAANKKLVKRLTNWLIGMTVVFLFIYIMGRRRLMLKIWARNKALKEALAKAEESDLMKSAFISGMSHEIRTPLNAVSGFSQVLCSQGMELSDEERLDMQQRIMANVDQITRIVNELLELSKSESEQGVAESDKEDVMVNVACRSEIESLADQTPEGVEMCFTTTLADDYTIRSNSYRLKRALSHLVSNAQKFTEQGRVEVHCEECDRQLLISVTDTGIGIAEADRERIFDAFSKVDDFKAGIGLGLPICRRLVRSLGGEVELDTSYSGGCRFVISLPLK